MSTLYLHGGMQKTGTTAIQHFLAENREALERQNAVYPDFSDIFNWVSNRRNAHWLLGKTHNEQKMELAVRRITELSEQYDTILLSDEQLWNNKIWDPAFWTFLKDLLAPCDVRIRLVVYVRRQDLYLYSNWAQSIKSMVDVPFKTFSFAQYIEAGYHERQHLDYCSIFDEIEPLLGKENILIRVYERGQLNDGSVSADFLHTVGLSADAEYNEPEKMTNLSLKDSVLETKRYLNRLPGFVREKYVKGDPFTSRLLQVQKELEEEGLLLNRTGFTNAQRSAFLSQYEESNAQTARRYLNREDGILFYERIPETDDVPQEYLTEELIEVCGRMILQMQDKIDEQTVNNEELRRKAAEQQKEIEQLKSMLADQEKKHKIFGRK